MNTSGTGSRADAGVPVTADFPMPSRLRTFIVEDSAVILEQLSLTLQEAADVEVVGTAPDEQSAIQWIRSHAGDRSADLIIVDVFLKRGSGLNVLQAARDANVDATRVVLTNYATPAVRARSAVLGAIRVFDKSTELDDLVTFCVQLGGAAATPG